MRWILLILILFVVLGLAAVIWAQGALVSTRSSIPITPRSVLEPEPQKLSKDSEKDLRRYALKLDANHERAPCNHLGIEVPSVIPSHGDTKFLRQGIDRDRGQILLIKDGFLDVRMRISGLKDLRHARSLFLALSLQVDALLEG